MMIISKKAGQAAVEFMAIVTIVLLFVAPLWYYGMQTREDITSDMALSLAKNAAKKIVSAADLVHSQRQNASVKITVFIPNGVTYANVSSAGVMFTVQTYHGEVSVFEESKANITGNIPTDKGTYYFFVQAMGDYVNLTMG